jgi:hypothetical protein
MGEASHHHVGPHAARPRMGPMHRHLLEYSSTTSLGCIHTVLQVDLIQGLTLHPLDYISKPQPPSLRHKSFGENRNPNHPQSSSNF